MKISDRKMTEILIALGELKGKGKTEDYQVLDVDEDKIDLDLPKQETR